MYQWQSNIKQSRDTFKGGKSIMDLVNGDQLKTKKTTFLYKSPNHDSISPITIPTDTDIEIVDFKGEFILVNAKNETNNKIQAWILVSDTNLDYNEFIAERLDVYLEEYVNEIDHIGLDFEKIALKDFRKKDPDINDFMQIPKDPRTRYQERTYPPFVEREKLELEAKRKLSGKFLGDLSKIYSFNKIFDPANMQADQNLEDKDRKFADARDKKVQFDVGYYPAYEKDEDVNDYLDMGNEMTATMEVLYRPETKGKPVVDKITLNYPLTYFVDNMKYLSMYSHGQFGIPTRSQVIDKIGLLPIMVAHEYIHTAQNTLVHFQDIAKLPNLPDAKEIERRKTMREILAHHHSIFPNKIYEDPKSDPVFIGAEFIRGKTAIFDSQSDWIQAFLLWMALDYLKRYEATSPPTSLSEKYHLKDIKADFETLRKDLTERRKINFGLGKEAFKVHLTELAKVSNGVFALPDEKMSKEDQEIIEKKAEEEKKSKEAQKEVKTDK